MRNYLNKCLETVAAFYSRFLSAKNLEFNFRPQKKYTRQVFDDNQEAWSHNPDKIYTEKIKESTIERCSVWECISAHSTKIYSDA